MQIFYEPVNLNQWNLFEKVKNIGHVEPFLATNTMAIGDWLLLHVGKQNKNYESGVYAVGEIVKGPFVLENSPDDYCNNKNTVLVKIIKINYSSPFIAFEQIQKYTKQFRTVHKIDEENYNEILDLINNQNQSEYVWYACYGSNINKARFMQYIESCSDTTPPVESRPFIFNHNIYFAKTARGWQNCGKAFLDDTAPGNAFGRVYKITLSQFNEIKHREGPDYRKQLYLGTIDCLPVFSFTDTLRNKCINVPSSEYFKTILNGLKECYFDIIDEKEICEYLIKTIMPLPTFTVAKTIRENDHFITNNEIAHKSGLNIDSVINYVNWLCSHNVIKQDRRSILAGHNINDTEAFFYTCDSPNGRALIDIILESVTENDFQDTPDVVSSREGGRHYVVASRIERSSRNRAEAIRLHGYKCQVCGFDFEETYGELGRNYIEVHHVNPLAEQNGEHLVNPETDLVCLCANCHRMIHKNGNQVLSVAELKALLNH